VARNTSGFEGTGYPRHSAPWAGRQNCLAQGDIVGQVGEGAQRRELAGQVGMHQPEHLLGSTERHCCIKAKGVLAAHQSGEAGPSGAVENGNKPGIRTPAAGLLGEQVDQVEQADRLMQQCQNQPSPENLDITDGVARSSQRDPK
jgi:hypothetical protein